jgi:hypothetical protein
MKNKTLGLLVSLLVVIFCIVIFFPTKIAMTPTSKEAPKDTTQNRDTPKVEKITYTNTTTDLIQVELPFPGAVVGKDFSVIGRARGNWFFEASFPIEVLDKDGKSLAISIAQPQNGEEWMTTNFVNFKSDIKIPQTYIGPATLVLRKDNPSGLAEHDASISFPITIEY